MTAPQTSVSDLPDLGLPGAFADLHTAKDGKVVSRTSEEASVSLPMGNFVAKGTDDRGVKLLSATTDVLEGIAMQGHGYSRDTELDDNGFRPGCTFDVAQIGTYIVVCEGAVTPSSEVHVRVVADTNLPVGRAGAVAVAGKTIDISGWANFETSGTSEPVKLTINATNRHLSVAE